MGISARYSGIMHNFHCKIWTVTAIYISEDINL